MIKLKFNEVKELAKEYTELGKEAFLVKRNVIKVDGQGNWTIMEYAGLKEAFKEACFGYTYETDIPYIFWQEVLGQVEWYIKKKEEREEAQNGGLETLAEQSHADN